MTAGTYDFSGYSCNERGKEKYYPGFDKNGSARRWYQHDIDTIIYSEMFRKMQRKSQLFSMRDPVSRSRLIHTFEVMRIAKEISERLGLNVELTEGIALAHDFGNVAYGKAADDFLKKRTNRKFKHEDISALMLKVASSRPVPDRFRPLAKEKIKADPSVLHTIQIEEFPWEMEVYQYKRSCYMVCISPELIDGVEKHGSSKAGKDILTLEGQVVNYADNIAYLIQDINDFLVTNVFTPTDIERYSQCLDEIACEDTNKNFKISDIVGKTTALRTAVLIERFIAYNMENLYSANGKPETPIQSTILKKDIPFLEIEPLVKTAIDKCWDFKSEYYDNEIIRLANINAEAKMNQIWSILDKDSLFREKNKICRNFMDFLDMPVFRSYRKRAGIKSDDVWENWKKACLIAHLTCDEIDLIINSCLSRDYSFDFSMPVLPVR